ncbi:16S rRNA (guanine(966)-N(2))-methyltransferase RsmD [Dehalobacter sp. DCM]|uniref:16S rRNA (guanine(966)-N(2))-methyltransferase RsmD n=1 Tax=Dehalobacter sp. DCM TaxID=2907827 RepID=UPI0030812DD6|nr:16S rRNA (guanine(966)-N(2))-methyltransferase RsmD [Dehalobacter sp. DCM]
MRIIAGDWKGRNLKTVKGMLTRPTSDKVKGAIFNILRDKVSEARVLDLFAGTGNLAWEALSRGAAYADLVDKGSDAVKTIKENSKMLGANLKVNIWQSDAKDYIKRVTGKRYDLIFADPPYRQGLAEDILTSLCQMDLLEPNGVIVIETSAQESITDDIYPLEIRLTKEYGDTKVWFIQKRENDEEGNLFGKSLD